MPDLRPIVVADHRRCGDGVIVGKRGRERAAVEGISALASIMPCLIPSAIDPLRRADGCPQRAAFRTALSTQ